MPRLYRESPLNSIWEGSGNVICLDVLRAMVRSPESLEVFFDEIERGAPRPSRGSPPALGRLKAELSDFEDVEMRARRIVERMALTLQGSLLVRHGDPAVADAFCASRLGGEWGRAFGTLPAGVDFRAIIERHRPTSKPVAGRRLRGPARDTIKEMLSGRSIPLVRIFGIRIGVDPSWFLALFLFIWWLTDYYQSALPGSNDSGAFAAGDRQRAAVLPVDPAARAGARGRRDPQRHRDRGHRPVAVRRHREDVARHPVARASSSGSPPRGRW